jgi:hypothetical protein
VALSRATRRAAARRDREAAGVSALFGFQARYRSSASTCPAAETAEAQGPRRREPARGSYAERSRPRAPEDLLFTLRRVSAVIAEQTPFARPAGQTGRGVRRHAFTSEEVSGPLGLGRLARPLRQAADVIRLVEHARASAWGRRARAPRPRRVACGERGHTPVRQWSAARAVAAQRAGETTKEPAPGVLVVGQRIDLPAETRESTAKTEDLRGGEPKPEPIDLQVLLTAPADFAHRFGSVRSPVQIRAPRFICADLQGFCEEGSGLGSGPWYVGIGTGRLDPFDFSPMKSLQLCRCCPQFEVNGFDLRRSAAKGTGGGMPGKCGFRWLSGHSVASLPNPCRNPVRGARGTSVRRSWPESFRGVPRRASGLALGCVR